METHPPKLIEDTVGRLIPPACREHVLGDMYERYGSPGQYLLDALAVLPLVIASQVRRTFRIQLFFAQACVLYFAFGGASLAAGPSYLYDNSLLPPLAAVIVIVLAALVLRDAYVHPEDRSTRRRVRLDVALALSVAWFAKGAIGLAKPEWTLPVWLMLAATLAGIPMLLMLRTFFLKAGPDTAIPAGSGVGFDETRRVSEEEYKRAWRANWICLVAALTIVFTTPKPDGWLGMWELGSAIFLIAIICATFRRSKRGEIGVENEFTSLSISNDPYRNRLSRKRDGLLFWAGGGLFGLLPGAGPTLILYLIALPLSVFLVRWVIKASYPETADAMRVWIAFVAFVNLCVAWVYVRKMNLRAAKAMRRELDALDSSSRRESD